MAFLSGDQALDAKIQEWLEWDRNDRTRNEIQQLVDSKNVTELHTRLMSRIEFGTAGMRSRMAAGNSMMNDLTIIQATQGLTKYLLDTCPNAKSMGVVIGYDARHNSKRWSELTSTVLVSQGIPVYVFSRVCPTPYVPFGVTHYGTACGIMITASHNPKEDNGYKVYWSNGAQIIPPVDKGISKGIRENLKPWDNSWNTDLLTSNLCKDPYSEIYQKYNECIRDLTTSKDINKDSPLFTYTAMHGVGYHYIQEAFRVSGFRELIAVKEQVEPDPEFPTVKYPNPEEGKGALLLSMQTADKNNSKVILANDPDADRLAIAEKLPNGEWKIFTGNEIGALLGCWCWETFRQQHPEVPASDVYMLASTVSSKILQSIGSVEGFNFVETLTGFKWMGNKSVQLMKEGKTVLFAFEEAIGFMVGTKVLDKDGISAAVTAAELVFQLHRSGSSLNQQLERIYEKYGHHLSNNSYFICHDKNVIESMFDHLRNFNGQGKYPTSCGPYKIRHVRDLTGAGFDSSKPGNIPELPTSSSQMITFTFENGCVSTLRTSGTEPKIKYYTEHCPDKSTGMDRDEALRELNDIVDNIITHFFQPEKRGLQPRAD
ncbi:phosphopentomutase [Patella vulgata]|uniref:phosphopentomutase n=1 Tax=Patella vulgata TaxID=6465 RepID=UPI0024A9F572|nr:phosphopentomutase [Patella vulgata]XP_055957448.1 phosphopentomutase [Patella vulgata]